MMDGRVSRLEWPLSERGCWANLLHTGHDGQWHTRYDRRSGPEQRVGECHTWFLRPKPDAHRMYAQDQVVIHTVRM
jgi:hypothetical protein